MALQPASKASCTSLSGFTPQGCRHGFRNSAPLCLHLEKLQMVSRGQLTPSLNSQGRSLIASAVLAVAQPPEQAFAAMAEGTATAESASMDNVLKETGETFPVRIEPTDLTPPELNINALEQSPDVGSFQSNSEAPINTAAAAAAADGSQEAASTASDSLSSDQFKSAKEAYEALLSGTQESAQGDSSVDVISQASKSFAEGLSEVKDTLANGLSNVQESFQSSTDNAFKTLKTTYDSINSTIIDSFKNISSPTGNSITTVQPSSAKAGISQGSFYDILTSPFQMGTPANNVLKVVVTNVEDTTGRVLAGTASLIARGYTSTKDFLPEDVQAFLGAIEKKLMQVSGPIQSVLEQVYAIILGAEKAVGLDPENPIIPIFIVVSGSISFGLIYRQLQYGGYSGDLTPASALELLKNESNIILIDIRPEEVRESDGIPDLRRQARFKVASVEQFKVEGSLQKLLKNVDDAEAAITAAAIKSLKNVQFNTKVILLDSDGSQSKRIARALKKAGLRSPYRIDGGFKEWGTNGLRVKQAGAETPLTIIKEETEAIWDEVKPTPIAIAVATLGAFAGLYALIEWEKTLQFLGLVCIVQVIYTRLNSYESEDDAKNDLKLLLRPFALATQGILWAAGQVEPNKLQLATSPSTSAVQDRVIQAAAKHGPLPSEYEQEQQVAEPAEEVAAPSKAPDDSPESQD